MHVFVHSIIAVALLIGSCCCQEPCYTEQQQQQNWQQPQSDQNIENYTNGDGDAAAASAAAAAAANDGWNSCPVAEPPAADGWGDCPAAPKPAVCHRRKRRHHATTHADASASATAGAQAIQAPLNTLFTNLLGNDQTSDVGAAAQLAGGLIADQLPTVNRIGEFVRSTANTLAATDLGQSESVAEALAGLATVGNVLAALSPCSSLADLLQVAQVDCGSKNLQLGVGLALNAIQGLQQVEPVLQSFGFGAVDDDQSAVDEAQQLLDSC